MRKFLVLLGAVLLSGLATSYVTPASAQATRTWVSGVGDDVNPCSRTAPCKTFAGTISKTAAGGEINCIDSGGFGAVTIVKSMAIKCDGIEGGVLVSSGAGVIVNAANGIVYLSGLDFEGLGETNSVTGTHGINFIQGAELHVANSVIRGFQTSGQGYGINFVPATTAGTSMLFVTDTLIADNGSVAGASGGGILIQPGAGVSVKAVINRTSIVNNRLGLRSDGTGSTGTISVAITDSVISNNAASGVTSFSQAGSAASNVMVNRSTIANNTNGLNANGAAAILRIGNSVVTGHSGPPAVISNGATMTSYNNNMIDDNASAGPVIPTTALK